MSNKVTPDFDGGQQEAEERELREPGDPLERGGEPGDSEVGVEMIGSGISANPYAAGGEDPEIRWVGGGGQQLAGLSPADIAGERAPAVSAIIGGDNTETHGELSNVGRDFPCFSFFFSLCVWLSVAATIGCYSQRCCHVSLPGEGLVLRGRRSDDQGDLAQVHALRNNGHCECAALGDECGCTKYKSTYTEGHHNKEREVKYMHFRCDAPLCCATGVCAHDASEPQYTWEKIEDTRRYPSDAERQTPICVATADTDSAAAPRTPNCNCCDSVKGWCNNDMLICAFTMMAVGWVAMLCGDASRNLCDEIEAFEKDRGEKGSLEERSRMLCDAPVALRFFAVCSHQEKRDKKEEKVVTHKADEAYGHFLCEEVGAVPLRADPAPVGGKGWQVAWSDSAGSPHVTSSRRGLVELRTELRISWKTAEERARFLAAYHDFCANNKQDSNQEYWVEAQLAGGTDVAATRELFLLGGSKPCCLDSCKALLWSIVGLGWVYTVWFDSLTAVMYLPMHKVLQTAAPTAEGTATESQPKTVQAL